MSTQANLLHDAPLRTEITAPAPISPLQIFAWSIRRELWDNHSLYLAPAIVAVLILLGSVFGPLGVQHSTYVGTAPGSHDRFTADVPYDVGAGVIEATAWLVSIFYAADALYAERRDRSILFWKSLPVSDLTTVLAKASVPTLLLPLITVAITVVTHLTMALASSVVLLRLGDPIAPLWSQLAFPHQWLWLLAHLFTVAALWYAPFYAWLLLISVCANRAPLLWAFLPPLALAVLEKIIFHTAYIGQALAHRVAHGNLNTGTASSSSHIDPNFGALMLSLNTPELWLGLLAAACFLTAAIQIRRYKGAL